MIVGKDDWPDRNYAMFVHEHGERLHCAFNTSRVDSGNFNSNATTPMARGIMSLSPMTAK